MAARFERDFLLRLDVPDGKGHAPGPRAAPARDAGTARVPRDTEPGAEAYASARFPLYTENKDDSFIFRRDDRMAFEERIREPLAQAGLNASPVLRRRLRDPNPSVRYRAIIAITAAVIVIAFSFTVLLRSMFALPDFDP